MKREKEAGCWILDAGCWILVTASAEHEAAGYWMLDASHLGFYEEEVYFSWAVNADD
jgi:hypothetical protein